MDTLRDALDQKGRFEAQVAAAMAGRAEQKEMDALPFQNGAADEGRIQDMTAREGATLAKLLGEKEKLTGKIYSQVLNPGQRTKADELRKCWSSRLEHVADRIGNTTGTK